MASSPYEKLLELAHQRALDGKGGLAASVAEMCLASKSALSDAELEVAFEILRLLVSKVEVKIRRHIADYLADRSDVPKDLVTFLANDDITVAYPIILHSDILAEQDLLDIILSRSARHRQAVAIRPNISATVTDKLVEFDETEVLTTLLCNETADLSEESLDSLVEKSLATESIREPLAHRKEMTPALAQRMYVWVGDALRDFIVANYDVSAETISETLDAIVGDTFGPATQPRAGDRRETLHAAPKVDARIHGGPPDGFAGGRALLRHLANGDLTLFESAFAHRLNLPVRSMGVILYDSGLETLAIASKAAGIGKDVFGEILCHLSGVRPAEDYKSSEVFGRMLDYFDRIDHAGAAAALNKWRSSPREAWRA